MSPAQPRLPKYLTEIDVRRPRQKSHKALHHAKLSLRESLFGFWPFPEQSRGTATLYELVDGEWKVKYHIPKGTHKMEPDWLWNN